MREEAFMNPVFLTSGLSAITLFIQSIFSALTFNHNSSYSIFSSSKSGERSLFTVSVLLIKFSIALIALYLRFHSVLKSTWQYSLSGLVNENILGGERPVSGVYSPKTGQ